MRQKRVPYLLQIGLTLAFLGSLLTVLSAQSLREGMGTIPHDDGVTFRVWAPNASGVWVSGGFNHWSIESHPMESEPGGTWAIDIAEAAPGDEYGYYIEHEGSPIAYPSTRRDPRARMVTVSDYSTGKSIVYDPKAFDWGNDHRHPFTPVEDLVIYQMHVGTFYDNRPDGPGTLDSAIERLDHVVDLGATAIQLLPVSEFPGKHSLGYDLSDVFAVENQGYGGPDAMKRFVRACHERGLMVFVDVVYNHWGPWDVHLHRFDGWWTTEYPGGIYFYDIGRIDSGWGPRPDYSRPEVREFILDNVRMWLEEYRVDGFRWDATSSIHRTRPINGDPLPDGWSLLREANDMLGSWQRRVISIAEDFWTGDSITSATWNGGLGFDSQWHYLASRLRETLAAPTDAARNMHAVAEGMGRLYNGRAFSRVIYTQSHDEVHGENRRLTVEIDSDNPDSWKARKLSTLGAAVIFAIPGIPMLYQGQEFLEQQPSDPYLALDWSLADTWADVTRLYRDLIALRLNQGGHVTAGLRGENLDIYHVNDSDKVLAWRRWHRGGPGDEVVVIANFSSTEFADYRVGFPRPGQWKVRCNTDSHYYGSDYSNFGSAEVMADGEPLHGMPSGASVAIAPYSALILSQDRPLQAQPEWAGY